MLDRSEIHTIIIVLITIFKGIVFALAQFYFWGIFLSGGGDGWMAPALPLFGSFIVIPIVFLCLVFHSHSLLEVGWILAIATDIGWLLLERMVIIGGHSNIISTFREAPVFVIIFCAFWIMWHLVLVRGTILYRRYNSKARDSDELLVSVPPNK
jgi:hypothetical protein